MDKKYYDDNRCVYCGKYETGEPDSEWGWFEIDEGGDKVCPDYFDKINQSQNE